METDLLFNESYFFIMCKYCNIYEVFWATVVIMTRILIEIPRKCVSRGSNDNESTLVNVITRGWYSSIPVPEPMMTQFIGSHCIS